MSRKRRQERNEMQTIRAENRGVVANNITAGKKGNTSIEHDSERTECKRRSEKELRRKGKRAKKKRKHGWTKSRRRRRPS